MTQIIDTCSHCAHLKQNEYKYPPDIYHDTLTAFCKAFPKGIPPELNEGYVGHWTVRPDQKGKHVFKMDSDWDSPGLEQRFKDFLPDSQLAKYIGVDGEIDAQVFGYSGTGGRANTRTTSPRTGRKPSNGQGMSIPPDLSPGIIEWLEENDLANGFRHNALGYKNWTTATTTHEIGHNMTTDEVLRAWNLARGRNKVKDHWIRCNISGCAVEVKRKYGATIGSIEEIAEAFTIFSQDNYVQGTLPDFFENVLWTLVGE
jgi:hypothetical protein